MSEVFSKILQLKIGITLTNMFHSNNYHRFMSLKRSMRSTLHQKLVYLIIATLTLLWLISSWDSSTQFIEQEMIYNLKQNVKLKQSMKFNAELLEANNAKCQNPTLITAGDENFFENLKNYVGSVHHWEPDLDIVIYDLGLSPTQRATAKTWKNVEVRIFDFDMYPNHVRNKRIFAWKPLLVQHAIQYSYCVLYLDSRFSTILRCY